MQPIPKHDEVGLRVARVGDGGRDERTASSAVNFAINGDRIYRMRGNPESARDDSVLYSAPMMHALSLRPFGQGTKQLTFSKFTANVCGYAATV